MALKNHTFVFHFRACKVHPGEREWGLGGIEEREGGRERKKEHKDEEEEEIAPGQLGLTFSLGSHMAFHSPHSICQDSFCVPSGSRGENTMK